MSIASQEVWFHRFGESSGREQALRVLSTPDPSELKLGQVMVLTEKDKQLTVHVISSKQEAERVRSEYRFVDAIGDPSAESLPDESNLPTLVLGGDYPELITHVLAHARTHVNDRAHSAFFPGAMVCLTPTNADETHGIFGVLDGNCHANFCFWVSKKQARMLLSEACWLFNKHEEEFDSTAARIKRSVAPDTAKEEAVPLDPGLSMWFFNHYSLYMSDTGRIK
jgi:hypothetical protein